MLIVGNFALDVYDRTAANNAYRSLADDYRELKEKSAASKDAPPTAPGPSLQAIRDAVDDLLGPVRSQAQEALEAAGAAESLASEAVSNPPIVLHGKDAILYSERSLTSIREQIAALQEKLGLPEQVEATAP